MFQKNANIDSSVFSVGIILQLMIYTNQTDLELQSFYTNDVKEGYVVSTLKTVMVDLAMVEKRENPYQSKIIPLRNMMELNCSKFYKELNDTILEGMSDYFSEEFDEFYIYYIFEKVCSFYKFMEYKHDKIMMKEVIYRLMTINNNMIHKFENLYSINISENFINIYIIVLMIYRPIRHFESTQIFLSFINKVSHSYTQVIYSYLVVNSLFEILLFAILRIFVLGNFIFINKAMKIIERFSSV